MYATPVIFPLSLIPANWRWLIVLNPLTMPIEIMKYSFLGEGAVDSFYYLLSLVLSFAVLLTGVFVFQKAERTFIDTV
jgi:lipopolysaccharide transport system permease protein